MKLHLDSPSPEQDVRIELIPLIDVIFCILTFFILAAMAISRQTAINVDLPQANTGATQMRDMFIVSIDEVKQLYIDKQPVTSAQLYQALVQYQQSNPQGLMVLHASRFASYKDVVDVLDILRSVGGDRVALATTPRSNTDSTPFQPTFPQFPDAILPGLNEPFTPYEVPTNPTDPFNPNQPLFPTTPIPSPGAGFSTPSQPSPQRGTGLPTPAPDSRP